LELKICKAWKEREFLILTAAKEPSYKPGLDPGDGAHNHQNTFPWPAPAPTQLQITPFLALSK